MVCCRVGRHGQAAAIMRSTFSCVKEPRTDMSLFAKESPLKRRDRHIRAEAVFISEPASLRVSPPPSDCASPNTPFVPLQMRCDICGVHVCCSVLQCVAVCCNMLKYVAMFCNMLQNDNPIRLFPARFNICGVHMCCSVLQRIAKC